MPTFLVVLLDVTVHVVSSRTPVIAKWTRKRLFSCVHANVHIKLLLGEKLFITVPAGMVISPLVPLLTETQLLLVFEFPTTCWAAEICFPCVRGHMVPGDYGLDAKELYNYDEKELIHAKQWKSRYMHLNTVTLRPTNSQPR